MIVAVARRPSAWHSCRSLLVRTVRANFAYRSAIFLAMITFAVGYAVTFLVWRYVYQVNGDTIGMPRADMYGYLALAFCLNFTLAVSPDHRIGQRIRMGLIATDLLKPIDFQLLQAIQSLGDLLYQAALSFVLLLVAATFLGPALLPGGPAALALFAPSLVLAFVILYGIGFIFAQGAFYTQNGYGIFATRMALFTTFSGLAAPLSFYPAPLRIAARCLPFQHTIYTPIEIYFGRLHGAAALFALGEQVLWGVSLIAFGRLVMRHALGQLEIQGG